MTEPTPPTNETTNQTTQPHPQSEPTQNANQSHRLLDILIERLYAGITRGPAINCYPGRSRQRTDFTTLEKLTGTPASEILVELLTGSGKWRQRITLDQLDSDDNTIVDDNADDNSTDNDDGPQPDTTQDSDAARRRQIKEMRALLRKLANISDDATQFQQDTGSHTLFIGYPLLSIAPSALGFGKSPRVLAPLAFIPVNLRTGKGSAPFVELSCAATGGDLVIMNEAIKVFLERQLAKTLSPVFEDEEGGDPAREIKEISDAVATMLELGNAPDLAQWPIEKTPDTKALPKGITIIPSAVLGLFHLENQNMIMDLQSLKAMRQYPPTVAPFLTLNTELADTATDDENEDEAPKKSDVPTEAKNQRHDQEFLVTMADPSQRGAIMMARSSKALVVHGPPGTGKSQTIANIVGDYLARDKRVLIVCDKRTALDVVKNRLDHLGIGHLCAVVHDATRDRTSLFKMIRDRLEILSDLQPGNDPKSELVRVNEDLNNEQDRLRAFLAALRDSGTGNRNFTELTGEWLAAFEANEKLEPPADFPNVSKIAPDSLDRVQNDIENILDRGRDCAYETNPWRGRHNFTLQTFMAHTVADLHTALDGLNNAAAETDSGLVGDAPVLPPDADLLAQSTRAGELSKLTTQLSQSAKQLPLQFPVFSPTETASSQKAIQSISADVKALDAPLDTELRITYDSAPQPLPQITTDLAAMRSYLKKGLGLVGWFQFSVRAAAKETVGRYGLQLSADTAKRLVEFLERLRNRILLQGAIAQHVSGVSASPLRSDSELSTLWNHFKKSIELFTVLDTTPGWQEAAERARTAMGDPASTEEISRWFAELQKDYQRRGAFLKAIGESKLFIGSAIDAFHAQLAAGEKLQPTFNELRSELGHLDCLLRMEDEARKLPEPLGPAALSTAAAGYDKDSGWLLILEPVLHAEIKRRLEQSRDLTSMDATAIETSIRRIQDLHKRKRQLVAEWINWKWTDRQRARLLAATGSRLNSDGADLRRRLALRGKNAGRVRQVIQQGINQQGLDDALFDICPVWMASPETVAQLFPLEPVFDAVVFDEASQCRLEQGIGVLARGSQVIIAGDTKQLPPTRFFESAVVTGTDIDPDSDDPDALFTSQQSEIEDLLTAALNIEVEQSFLEIHYRSSRSELIEFSNRAFYGGRLHALPARPDVTTPESAVRLHQIDGVYQKRRNETEADYVVTLVKKWLSKPNPPSIGIVTFNLTQKDLITDKLEDASLADESFAALLETARSRQGEGSFEGLFVKNLESVQGDERDVIILSCTYGRDEKGKFYRRFGPLAMTGGERRLNVIITRARDVVEVVSSIPEKEYMTLENVPDGSKPTGSWHFMNYLRYARKLRDAQAGSVMPVSLNNPNIRHSRLTDSVVDSLKSQFQLQPVTYLGTEGFHVDIAFPVNPGEPAISGSLQIDGSRYTRAHDPAEWEVYQSGILKSRDWNPAGIWSPHIFRDPKSALKQIAILGKK